MFVETRRAVALPGPPTFAAPIAPVGRGALADDRRLCRARELDGHSRGHRRARAVGNLFEFSVAFATSILFGYLVLSRRYPISGDRVHPGRASRSGSRLYARRLPSDSSRPLVPPSRTPRC